MTRLVALLKGINVGGNKQVDMATLRTSLEGRGYTKVETYLRSGNVAFNCTAKAAKTAVADIEATVVETFGFESRVVARTAADLERAMAADPLLDVTTDPARHFVGFCSSAPAAGRVVGLTDADYGPNLLSVIDDHVYLWCPDGMSASPFFRMKFERLLDVEVTFRNWTTVLKLALMAA
jgi:uncharacterized protein (DUF1697 family)